MSPDLHINWRGPLSSCNYDCPYCPFAKRVSSRRELEADEADLERFVGWCERGTRTLSILFTPWGEGLIRASYQRALVRLSHLPQVRAVAIQTNLSCRLDWLAQADLDSLGLWTTFHPGEVTLERFLARTAQLDAFGVRYSVGVVGLREHFEIIGRLRAELAPSTYLWINAYKREPGYYTQAERDSLTAIDPLFPLSATRHPSLGRDCHTGHSAIFVDGGGEVRRCHFVAAPLGNLYDQPLEQLLRPSPSPCPERSCGCFIGYTHLTHLDLRPRFGSGFAARRLAVLES